MPSGERLAKVRLQQSAAESYAARRAELEKWARFGSHVSRMKATRANFALLLDHLQYSCKQLLASQSRPPAPQPQKVSLESSEGKIGLTAPIRLDGVEKSIRGIDNDGFSLKLVRRLQRERLNH